MPTRRRRRRKGKATVVPSSFIRRRSTRWLIAACITLALGLTLSAIANCTGSGISTKATPTLPSQATVTATAGGASSTATPEPSGEISPPDLNPDTTRLIRGDVVDIIDGDTIDVRIDGQDERLRYYGVDTPERGDACYGEAKDRNEALAGDTVLLLPDARNRDRGGRLLRYVFDEHGDSIDAALIAEGLAHAWPDDGSYRDTLVALERQAQAASVGCLWTQ